MMPGNSEQRDGLSDDVLLEKYRRDGDVGALEQLVERYRRPLFAFIGRYGDWDGAEDIVQEVWLRVLKKPSAFRGGNFAGWLFRVCRNYLIDRSRKRRELTDSDVATDDGSRLSDSLVDPGIGPDQAMIRAEETVQLQDILNGLPTDQAEVFIMRTQGGLRFREIAVAQQCSINTVLARMRYALDRIHRRMGFAERGGGRE